MKTLSKESLDDGLTEPKDSMLSLTPSGEKLKKSGFLQFTTFFLQKTSEGFNPRQISNFNKSRISAS